MSMHPDLADDHERLGEAPTQQASTASPDSERARRWLAALLVPLVLVATSGALRFHRLGDPDRIYFDETYYASDARAYLERGVEEGFAVHPPVGKWLLAGGIAVFGDDSFGWRFSAAVAGTLTVLVVYLAGLRLFRRRGIAALAALLLSLDGLAFTMSRIAMLDVFLGLFVALGFWLLVLDRDEQWAALDARPLTADAVVPRATRRWRWLAGVAFGLALATKWSALLAIGAAGLFVLGSELALRRRATGRFTPELWRVVASGIATLVVVPLAVYFVSYGAWFANYEETRLGLEQCGDGECDTSVGAVLSTWWRDQVDIARFHDSLTADHPYRATADTWPTLSRPVAYYYESCDDGAADCVVAEGQVAEILGIGNPAIWWMALVAYPLVVFFAVRDRDWRAWAILLFLLAQYLPWRLVDRPLFLFYMTPAVPFIALSLAYVAWRAQAVRALRWLPPALATVAALAFLYWYPLFVGLEIPRDAWDARIWRDSWI